MFISGIPRHLLFKKGVCGGGGGGVSGDTVMHGLPGWRDTDYFQHGHRSMSIEMSDPLS